MKPISPLSLILSAALSVPMLSLPSDAVSLPHSFQIARQGRRLSWRVGVRPSRYHIGGLSRSAKCPDQSEITALVPPPRPEEKLDKNFTPVETTFSAHPTFWVVVQAIPPNTQLQFTLQNATGTQELYNTHFSLDQPTGILGIRLPTRVAALKAGEAYLWQMAVQCNPEDRSEDIVIGRWVQRVAPNQIKPAPGFDPTALLQELNHAPDRDQPALYAGLGIWPDAVTALIDLQQRQPNNRELKEDWRNLLEQAQMSKFLTIPLLGVK
jgi:hypothetical protein